MSRFYHNYDERQAYEKGREDERYHRHDYGRSEYEDRDRPYFEGKRDERRDEERRREEREVEELRAQNKFLMSQCPEKRTEPRGFSQVEAWYWMDLAGKQDERLRSLRNEVLEEVAKECDSLAKSEISEVSRRPAYIAADDSINAERHHRAIAFANAASHIRSLKSKENQ